MNSDGKSQRSAPGDMGMVSSRAEEVLGSIERYARSRYLPIMGVERGMVLADLVRRVQPKRVLEVGTLLGYSTILMAKELESDAEIITIEIDEDEAEMAENNIRDAEVKPKVTVLVGNALKVIPKLSGKFDFVFLDAVKSEYLSYLRLVEDKLPKGGTVAADNAVVFAYSMKDYLDYVRHSRKYESHLIEIGGDGIEVSTRL